jgi:hypothetical protein
VTALHRAACLAGQADQPVALNSSAHAEPPILLTTFNRNLADALDTQLARSW